MNDPRDLVTEAPDEPTDAAGDGHRDMSGIGALLAFRIPKRDAFAIVREFFRSGSTAYTAIERNHPMSPYLYRRLMHRKLIRLRRRAGAAR
jgi:hypothetical protein